MTATTSEPTLTPARKRLIRMTYHNYGTEAPSGLLDMPSFAGITRPANLDYHMEVLR